MENKKPNILTKNFKIEDAINLMFDKLIEKINKNGSADYFNYYCNLTKEIKSLNDTLKMEHNELQICKLHKMLEIKINQLLKYHDENKIIIPNYTSTKMIQLLKNNFICKLQIEEDNDIITKEVNIWEIINPTIINIKYEKNNLYLTVKMKYEFRIKLSFDHFGTVGVYNKIVSANDLIYKKLTDTCRYNYFIFLDEQYYWNCESIKYKSLTDLLHILFYCTTDFALV